MISHNDYVDYIPLSGEYIPVHAVDKTQTDGNKPPLAQC